MKARPSLSDRGEGASAWAGTEEVGALTLTLPARGVRCAYLVILLLNVVIVLATLLSDLGIGVADSRLGRQLDLKLEGNVAVWYSSLLLLLAGAGAFCVGQRMRGEGTSRFRTLTWMLAGLFFVALSVDETAQLHEKIGIAFTHGVGRVPGLTERAVPMFAWLVALLPLIVLFVVCILAAARQIGAWEPRSRRLMLGGLACWIGVLVAEFVQAQLLRAGRERSIQGAIEEGLEVFGATLFLFAFVEFCRRPATSRP